MKERLYADNKISICIQDYEKKKMEFVMRSYKKEKSKEGSTVY